MRRWLKVLGQAARGWNEDNAFQHSAAVGFYTLFSLAPITVIATGIAGFFLGQQRAERQVLNQLSGLVGPQGAQMVAQAATAALSPRGNWLSASLGIVLLLVGATSVFSQLQYSLNAIWGVRANPQTSGLGFMVVRRLLSFAMVLTVGFLLLVSLIVSSVLTAWLDAAHGTPDVSPVVVRAVDFGVSLLVISILFALFFKVLPDVQLQWSDVWGSALLTALLFGAGRLLIGVYLGHSTIASIYGAAGSLVALLVWVYYSSAIMFFGVEATRAHCLAKGEPVVPKRTAVLVRREIVPPVNQAAET